MNAAHNTGDGASARNVTTVSDETGATADTMDVTDYARRGARREELGICADSRVAAVETTDSVTDARREWEATRGAPGRLLGVLGSCSHRHQLPCYAALRVRGATDLRFPAYRSTLTVEETVRKHSDNTVERLWQRRWRAHNERYPLG